MTDCSVCSHDAILKYFHSCSQIENQVRKKKTPADKAKLWTNKKEVKTERDEERAGTEERESIS